MIVFGTDGWRGEIARDFTFSNLQLVAMATAKYLKKEFKEPQSVVIGYDTRFLSKEFAYEVAQILAWQGIIVHITDTFSSTPQVSFHTKQKGTNLGLVITASHNPANYNGFKVKGAFGGPASPEQIATLETELRKIEAKPIQMAYKSVDDYMNNRKLRIFNAKESYIRYIKKKVDVDLIKAAKFKILYNPMYGAGINTFGMLIPGTEEINSIYNPSFGDLDHPEPIQEHLNDMMDQVRLGKYDIGIATDGDADRLGLVDHEGNFVDSHKIFMIILKYLFEKRKKRGAVAKTVTLTSMVNLYCQKQGIKLYETPVGFKYIAKLMVKEKILIGGEESGGMGTILHIPERDGLFNAMLILEIMAAEKKSLNALCNDLDKEFGTHRYWRRDVKVTPQLKKQIISACEKKPKTLGRFEIIKTDTTDGYKFYVKNGWLMIRASGTEPLIRFYAEAESMSMVSELLDEGFKLKK
ncbi:MAG: phosphoglucomutase/phosphomannomutase family protein [Candidatus Kapabacteria bacterium]|nr:phosphoglucomutase/phosphomannomutase family protein [Candidatus Kapabacteria bacterium]